jgi:alcohol dehydrogenase, propanol-preferring
MHAVLFNPAERSLKYTEVAQPVANDDQVLIRVSACAVCRTDLHVVDGELPNAKQPLIPGHEIVGVVVGTGAHVGRFAIGDRVGVPWLGWTCGVCEFCCSGRENLCDKALFTGYQIDGGFAEYTVADQQFCFAIPDMYSDVQAAPLLCAGLIGYRALRIATETARDAQRIGIYGFGAAAHIITQVACYQQREVFAFTRSGDTLAQRFARELGAVWTGDSVSMPPQPLDAAIIFAPVGSLVPMALRAVAKGGAVVCAGIHMSDIPSFPYADLWEERCIRSVANLTRRDAEEFLALAPRIPIATHTTTYPLSRAAQALDDLRYGKITGAAVLVLR